MSTYDFDPQSTAAPVPTEGDQHSMFSFAGLGSVLQGLKDMIWRNDEEHQQKMDAASHTSFIGTQEQTKALTDTTDPNFSTRLGDQIRAIKAAGNADVNQV